MVAFLIILNILSWIAFLVAEIFFREKIINFESKLRSKAHRAFDRRINNFCSAWLAKQGLTITTKEGNKNV